MTTTPASAAHPAAANPTLATVFPPLSSFVSLRAGFEALPDDEVAKIWVHRLEKAIEEHRAMLTHVIREHEAAANQQQLHPLPPVDLKTMERELKKSSEALEIFVARLVPAQKLKELHDTHSGVVAVAEELVKLAVVQSDPTVVAVGNTVASELRGYVEAKARVEAGGHAALDEPTSKVVTRLWAILDGGFLALESCLLIADIVHSDVLQDQPPFAGPKNPLRHRVNAPQPNPGGRPKKAEKNKDPKGGSKGGSGGSTPPKDGSGDPPKA